MSSTQKQQFIVDSINSYGFEANADPPSYNNTENNLASVAKYLFDKFTK